MKYICIILIAFLTLGSVSVKAQNSPCDDCPKCNNNTSSAVVTKGYYAIGDNAKKLDKFSKSPACGLTAPALLTTADNRQPVAKGFYSISDNQSSLAPANTLVVAEKKSPAVQKGFYAIGTNNNKIDKPKTIALDHCICYNN